MRSPPTGLPVTRLVAERTHHVVAHLECVAQRQSVVAEVGQEFVGPVGCGEHGTEVQRALDRVLAGLVAADPLGLDDVACPLDATENVEVLADVQLDAQLVPDLRDASGDASSMSWSA